MLRFCPPGDVIRDSTFRWAQKLPGKWSGRVERRWLHHAERSAWREACRRDVDVFHYLYPENTCFSGTTSAGNQKVVVSCHQPASFVQANREGPALALLRRSLEIADVVVVLAPDEVGFYRELAPRARVAFVPHGIDTEWFSPAGAPDADGPPKVLTVGNWLRDHRVWAQTVELAAERGLDLRFQILANQNVLKEAVGGLGADARKLVEVLHGVDDARLRELYREAAVSFLPLKGATANNALLESLACGIPVVTTDLSATRAYAADGAEYVPGADPGAALMALEGVVGSSDLARRLSIAGRRAAEERFSWPAVIGEIDSLAAHSDSE